VLWIYLAQCLQFFGYAFFTPASVYYVNQVVKDADKVKGQTFMGMAFGISNLIGNFSGGLMLDASGSVTFMLTVGTVISIVGLIALLWIDNFHARQAKNQPSSLVETP
jgi:PPP family 3-phenylpropionic acid transporter